MIVALIILSVFSCASLAACSFLYAERRQLNRLVTRQDALLEKQDKQLTDWQDKALARNSMTPLGEEREERPQSGLGVRAEAPDLRPLIARAHEQWDAEEDAQLERERGGLYSVPLPSDVQNDLLEAAREVAS